MIKQKISSRKISVYISVLVLFAAVLVPQVKADDIAISGNGSASTNSVTSNNSPQTTIESNNNANINNSVKTTADTGSNKSSGNSGSASTNTGDVNTTTNISNAANSSTVKKDNCCQSTPVGNTVISNNGSGSENKVATNNNSNTSINVNNNANITNNVATNASTGNNSAGNNNGNVSINTGDINSQAYVQNDPVNISRVTVPSANGENQNYSVSVEGNGAFSENKVTVNNKSKTTINQNNNANIINDIQNVLSTGNNSAYGNEGNVSIKTGDILSIVGIKNAVNFNEVTINCNQPEKPNAPIAPSSSSNEVPPTSAPAPSTTSSGSSSSSSSSSSPVQEVAAAAASLLPITGNNWLFFAMFANVIMIFLGAYLRLRSGRSPSAVYAF